MIPEPMNSGPRAILAIDGGGARGVLALEILVALEAALARARNDPNTRLADCFALMAGTSVGAVLAVLFALGLPAATIREAFERTLRASFTPASWRHRFYHRYDKRYLENHIKEFVGADTQLGSPRLRTLLLLALSNATTNSPWIVSNHPHAPFNRTDLDDCNLRLPLWQLIRASAAAPSYFAPETVTLGRERPYRFMFMDGGLTGYNNPAFKAFLFATTEPYGVNWRAHEDQLTVVSVGTGELRPRWPTEVLKPMNLFRLAARLPATLMDASAREQDLLCRTFGRCRLGSPIDGEVHDMLDVRTAIEPRLFTYYRINPVLSHEGLEALGCGNIDPLAVMRLDAVGHMEELQQIGAAVGRQNISEELLARLAPCGRVGRPEG
jgi:hypothetical protein